MGKCPGCAGKVGVAAHGLVDGQGGPGLDAWCQQLALELTLGHQAVEVRVGARKPAVDPGKRAELILRILDKRALERLGL
jgi:hypothetical protein